jgi:hypothetical protein
MGNTRFEFDENAYYSKPEVKSNDPDLLKEQAYCQKYLNQKIQPH